MTTSDLGEPGAGPVLDEHGMCCPDAQGTGQCDPSRCVCGPDLHKVAMQPEHAAPEAAEPMLSAQMAGQRMGARMMSMAPEEAETPFMDRVEMVTDIIRAERGLTPNQPVPPVTRWTGSEVALALPILFPGVGSPEPEIHETIEPEQPEPLTSVWEPDPDAPPADEPPVDAPPDDGDSL